MKNPMMQQLQTDMIQQFNQFRRQMEGKDPRAMVMDLLNSGKMSPSQFEELKKQAMEMEKIFRF